MLVLRIERNNAQSANLRPGDVHRSNDKLTRAVACWSSDSTVKSACLYAATIQRRGLLLDGVEACD